MTSPDTSLDGVRRELGALREELSGLTAHLRTLQRQADQLAALHAEEPDAAAKVERLERVLTFEKVAAHFRDAVAQAPLIQDPVPHLWVSQLLPPDVYQAVIDAIPARAFFDDRAADANELRVPPRVAPTHSIVTWAFLTDVVLRALSSALVARFHEPLAAFTSARFPTLPPFGEWDVEVTLSQGRIVLRGPGYVGAPLPDRPWDFLTTVVCLARPNDDEAFGSRLHGDVFPFRANSALTFLGPAQAHEYLSIPHGEARATDRYTYEFGVGPTREGRRTLTAMMKNDPARAASAFDLY